MTNSIVDRVSNIAHNINTTAINLPKSIKIELASICNHRCEYCIVPKLSPKQPFMTEMVFKRVLKEVDRLNIPEVGVFHMGEGTLHPQFIEFIQYLRKEYPLIKVFLTTNGTQLQKLKASVKENINSIKFSLNGYNKEVHKKVTGVDTFDLVMDNLRELIKYRNAIKSSTQISASSIYYNCKGQDEFSEYISQIVDKYYFTQIYNQANKVDNKFIQLTNNKRIIPNLMNLPCFGLYNLCHIKVNGDVNLCRFGIDDEFTIGNILENNLDTIWFSHKATEIRNKSTNKQLKTCNDCIRINNGI